MTLRQIKIAMSMTECKDFLYSSGYCSEPIMTKDKDGKIIDNFFIFSRSNDFSFTEVPSIAFGIRTEEMLVAYVNKNVFERFDTKQLPEVFADSNQMKMALSEYTKIYPTIRDMYDGKLRKEESTIEKYLEYLECISGKALFSIYQKLYPDFFEWAYEKKDHTN